MGEAQGILNYALIKAHKKKVFLFTYYDVKIYSKYT